MSLVELIVVQLVFLFFCSVFGLHRILNCYVFSVIEIRRKKRDNLGIIIHITHLNVCRDTSFEPSRGDGFNEGSQHMFR